MGHIRLHRLPRTQRWNQVIALLNQGESVESVAEATFWAAHNGLKNVPLDAGFTQTLTTIFNFIDAVQAKDPFSMLRKKGFDVSPGASLFELIDSFQNQAARATAEVRARSDLSKIAQETFSQVLFNSTGASLQTLFGVESNQAEKAVQASLKGKELGHSMHEFFVGFTKRYLDYYLGRELPAHVGVGKAFKNIDQHSEFGRSFDLYIRQTIRISDEFTPGWFGRARYEGRLSHDDVARFAHVAFKKIRSELRRSAKSHG